MSQALTKLRQTVRGVTPLYTLIFTSTANTVGSDEKAALCCMLLSLLLGVQSSLENKARAW